MRVASHIDFRTAVKMSQQGAALSGMPTLTPLPTSTHQIIEECGVSYSSSPDQYHGGFSSASEMNSYHISGRLSPQTPEATMYHEPLSMGEHLDGSIASQPWPGEALALYGLEFGQDLTAILPADTWPMSMQEDPMLLNHISWPKPGFPLSTCHQPTDLMSHTRAVPSLSLSECSVEDFDTSTMDQAGWSIYPCTTSQVDMQSTTISTPFMSGLACDPSHAPIWEDVFMPPSLPY